MDIGELKSVLNGHNDNERVLLHNLVTGEVLYLQHDDTLNGPGLYLMLDIEA